MMDNRGDVLILTGPTGSGKTQLGMTWAERLGGEIISMDSMAIYRGLDIGTAKPTLAQRQRVPHYMVDVLEPWESGSVAWWLERAQGHAAEIRSRGRRVIFVGGTPLYLTALLRGLFDGPAGDENIRARLQGEAGAMGSLALYQRLAQADPPAAQRIHPHDLRRIVRALEVLEITGRPISAWQRQWQQPGFNHPPAVWLDLPRPELYARINRRVEEMFATGLVEEVRRLRALPMPLSREAGQALGYKEVLAHLDGRATLPETIKEVQTRSRQFAKRQISWFRRLSEVRPATQELTESLWDPTIL